VWAQAWPDYLEQKAMAVKVNGEFVKDEKGKRRNPMNCLCLCICCLERRLGRQIVKSDFDDSRANGAYPRS
jgi:hypothetical protein